MFEVEEKTQGQPGGGMERGRAGWPIWICWVISGQLQPHSGTQFPHLYNGMAVEPDQGSANPLKKPNNK